MSKPVYPQELGQRLGESSPVKHCPQYARYPRLARIPLVDRESK